MPTLTAADERVYYHMRGSTIVEMLRLADSKALDLTLAGWDLWPAEWGVPTTRTN